MTKTIEDLFYILLFITDALLIILLGFLLLKGKMNNPLKIIITYCTTSLVTNCITEFFPFPKLNLLYSFFTLIEYVLFAAFIYSHVKSLFVRRGILILSILFALFLPIHTFTSTVRSIDSVPIGLETILILIYSFYFFYEQMNDVDDVFIYSKYPFWIVTGMIIYLAGSFFIYIFANQVERHVLDNFWFITYAFYVLKNILFAFGILTYVKQTKNPLPGKLYPYLN